MKPAVKKPSKKELAAKMTIGYVNQLYKESGLLLTMDEIDFIYKAIQK
jgi:hypothetical protein